MFFLKPILHRINPEIIHASTVELCSWVNKIPQLVNIVDALYQFEDSRLHVSIGNLDFPNPIGLAAGYDKNGVAVPVLQALGFGFVEVGTVTPKAQSGNSKPRLYRLRPDNAIINRMGFNNYGVQYLVKSLESSKKRVPIGVNVGKNKQTPVADAHKDYITCIKKAWDVADYFTVNISSPNTKNLRDLQKEDYLVPFIKEIISVRNQLSEETNKYKQLWLKIAPDLDDDELRIIAHIALDLKIDAIVLTNTTITRPGLTDRNQGQTGGLSGKPLFDLSNHVLKKMHDLTHDRIPLIGVGGIFSVDDVQKKISLGAKLVQIYTGLIFEGPGLIKRIKREMISMERRADM